MIRLAALGDGLMAVAITALAVVCYRRRVYPFGAAR
jgi:hypothetical protein